jgi:hypothetical protein
MSTVGQLKQVLADLPDEELIAVHLFFKKDVDTYLNNLHEEDYVPFADKKWEFVVRMFEQPEGQNEEFTDCIWYSATE